MMVTITGAGGARVGTVCVSVWSLYLVSAVCLDLVVVSSLERGVSTLMGPSSQCC